MSGLNPKEVLIGQEAKVIGSSNPSYVGIEGVIVDETANMLDIESKDGNVRRLIKKNVIIEIDGERIDGIKLIGRPENRIKNRVRKNWR
ncbi:MAG TPA: ribonuclease P protein subunit [Candidatus Methanofastidiosa archaeon]|nr:ribonuclease P protein subunit [Candidatus Methanofastidiosa archaeon]